MVGSSRTSSVRCASLVWSGWGAQVGHQGIGPGAVVGQALGVLGGAEDGAGRQHKGAGRGPGLQRPHGEAVAASGGGHQRRVFLAGVAGGRVEAGQLGAVRGVRFHHRVDAPLLNRHLLLPSQRQGKQAGQQQAAVEQRAGHGGGVSDG